MRESLVKKSRKTVVLGLLLMITVAGQAMAAASLVSTTPEASGTVTERPSQIDLQFSETLRRIDIAVSGPKGRRVTTTVELNQNDKSQVFASFWDRLAPGRYSVRWTAVSLGKQRSHGSYSFTVKPS